MTFNTRPQDRRKQAADRFQTTVERMQSFVSVPRLIRSRMIEEAIRQWKWVLIWDARATIEELRSPMEVPYKAITEADKKRWLEGNGAHIVYDGEKINAT